MCLSETSGYGVIVQPFNELTFSMTLYGHQLDAGQWFRKSFLRIWVFRQHREILFDSYSELAVAFIRCL